jgi:hypothetical protein
MACPAAELVAFGMDQFLALWVIKVMAAAAAFVFVGQGGKMLGMQGEIHAGFRLCSFGLGAGPVAAPTFAFQGA